MAASLHPSPTHSKGLLVNAAFRPLPTPICIVPNQACLIQTVALIWSARRVRYCHQGGRFTSQSLGGRYGASPSTIRTLLCRHGPGSWSNKHAPGVSRMDVGEVSSEVIQTTVTTRTRARSLSYGNGSTITRGSPALLSWDPIMCITPRNVSMVW